MAEVEKKKIFCPKCGAMMNEDSRYCLRCGTLNVNHPENSKIKKYIKIDHSMGHNKYVQKSANTGKNVDADKENIVTLVFNILLLIMVIAGGYFLNLPIYYYILCVVIIFYSFCLERMFIKWDQHWYIAIVPIYGLLIYFEIVMGSVLYFFLSLIPGVNLVVFAIAQYKLGKAYQVNGFLNVFFPAITIPLFGLSKTIPSNAIHEDIPDEHGVTNRERNYKIRHFLYSVLICIAFVLTMYLCFPYIKEIYENFLKYMDF